MPKVRFGLIGYGLFGAHHARAIERCASAELVAIAVRSQSSQTAARQGHPSANVYADYCQLLAHNDIDVVSVVAPNSLHYEIGMGVLRSNKHLLLEKPMALQLAHCDELIAEAASRQLMLAIGHELRLSSLWGRAKELIDQGAIGEPLHVLIELSRFPYRQGSQGWRYDTARVGSWILEEPIHFFDLARWYLSSRGEPTSVFARANSRQPDHSSLLDNFTAVVDFPSAYAVISQTLSAFGHHQTAKIAGTEGTIWAWWSAADARSDRPTFELRYGLGEKITEETFAKPAGELLELADEIAAIAKSVREGVAPPCTGRDGRWSTLLCLAAERAVITGSQVKISEFANVL